MATVLAEPDAQRVILGYQFAVAAVRARVLDYLNRVWGGLGRYDRADIDRFISAVLPAVQAGQLSTAALTDTYLATLERTVLGTTARAVGVNAAQVSTEALRGVPAVEVYRRAGVAVWRALKDGVPYEAAVERGRQRAETLAATDLQLAKTHTARRAMAQNERVVGHRRSLRGGSSCGLCVVASTQRYDKDRLSPIHPGCVPSGSLVSAEGVVAVTRRWHTGELVVLRSASGDEVAVTPDHPVLTDQGWVPARLVREGDDLLRSLGAHGAVLGRPAERHRPALVEDVWRAASVSGVLLKMPLAPEDLHGDGAHGEVDVVWPHGHLPPVGNVTFGQPVSECLLVAGRGGRSAFDAGSSLALFLERDLSSASGLVGGGGLGLALGLGHLGGTGAPGLAASPRFDAPAEEFSFESAPVYAQRGVDLVRRLAGLVERDRVVEARRVSWSGHVYNLHTAGGWYSANNHIVSNCDCGIIAIYGDKDPGLVIDPDRLDRVHDLIDERFGAFNSGARQIPGVTKPNGQPLQYRDVLITHTHGELGEVLAVRGQHWTGPDDI